MCQAQARWLKTGDDTDVSELEKTGQEDETLPLHMTRLYIRLSALAAVVGGLLRIAASFAPVLLSSNLERQSLYFAVDVCLTLGFAGFWWRTSKTVGRLGTIGLAMFVTGIAIVRASAFISAVDVYPAGALLTAGGAIVVSVGAWSAHRMADWVPLAFVLSTLLGILGSVTSNAGGFFVWSGVIFGLAFAGVGCQLWISSSA
jgi:hypothetical protein